MEDIDTKPRSGPSTVFHLLGLLNKAKRQEFGYRAWPFTLEQLFFFSDPKKNHIYYLHHFIPKKSGGVREISSPSWMLKMFQASAKRLLQDKYVAPDNVMGFVSGRSVADNAARHIGKNYVFNADLKDFFPSITRDRVISSLMKPPFCFGKEAALLLSGICCAHADLTQKGKDTYWVVRGEGKRGKLMDASNYHPAVPATLPQGAPSSPVLSNAVCLTLDKRLDGLAKRYKVTYTRYADDITFSSNHNVFREGDSFMKEFRNIIKSEGFILNEDKLRLQNKGQRQEVTGLIVNKKISVSRQYIRSIGSLLYIWERYGVDAAYGRFLKYKTDLEVTADNRQLCTCVHPHLLETMQGRIAYVRMVRGEDDPVWKRLNERFLKLKAQYESRGVVGNPTRILHSWTIKRFEQLSGFHLRYGPLYSFICPWEPDIENYYFHQHFYLEKNGFKTPVYPSQYCKTRMSRANGKGAIEEIERLKSTFRIGLCAYNMKHRFYSDCCSEKEYDLILERRAKKLTYTYRNMDVCWKIFRKPPDIEDLPY